MSEVIRRFCKGCELEVTHSMWCACGGFPIGNDATITEDELKRAISEIERFMQDNGLGEEDMINDNQDKR